MSTLLPSPGAHKTPLKYSLVQSTLCLRTLCTEVCTSLLEELAIHSAFRTDIGLDNNAIDSVDSEPFLF